MSQSGASNREGFWLPRKDLEGSKQGLEGHMGVGKAGKVVSCVCVRVCVPLMHTLEEKGVTSS